MSKKPIFIFIGFLLIIFALGKYSVWQIEKWKKSLPPEFPTIAPEEIPKITQLFPTSTFPLQFPTSTYPLPESFSYPGITQPTSSQEIKIEEFISPDGKLKIKYPSNFVKFETISLQKAVPEELAKNYKMEIIFFAQKFDIERPASLVISQMLVDKQTKLKDILEEMKKAGEKEGWRIEILETEQENEKIIVESTYWKENIPAIRSKEKMLSIEIENNQKRVFIAEITTANKDWNYLKDEINKILDSAQLVK
jgi:hypothetical protein